MKYRVNLDFIGVGNAAAAYGGSLQAWSFESYAPQLWFEKFRRNILDSMGKEFKPVYRMADGEYRFLMGREYNFNRRPLLRELVAVTAEKIRIRNPDKWTTSWGESYSPKETKALRSKLIAYIKEISVDGYLACYINDNGLHAFTEYNALIESYFKRNQISFNAENYIPFHFVAGLLVNAGWQDFLVNRSVLVVTGLTPQREKAIEKSLKNLGIAKCYFKSISATSSMHDTLDLCGQKDDIDLCLVAAGIGSANILRQLRPLQTVALDIGGFMNCYENPNASQHGGIFRLPLNL